MYYDIEVFGDYILICITRLSNGTVMLYTLSYMYSQRTRSRGLKYRQISNKRRTKPHDLNVFRLVLQLSWGRYQVENEDVIGDAPPTSEWSTNSLPAKVRLILEVGGRSNFETAITPSIFKLECRSKAHNVGNAISYLDYILNYRWPLWRSQTCASYFRIHRIRRSFASLREIIHLYIKLAQ